MNRVLAAQTLMLLGGLTVFQQPTQAQHRAHDQAMQQQMARMQDMMHRMDQVMARTHQMSQAMMRHMEQPQYQMMEQHRLMQRMNESLGSMAEHMKTLMERCHLMLQDPELARDQEMARQMDRLEQHLGAMTGQMEGAAQVMEQATQRLGLKVAEK